MTVQPHGAAATDKLRQRLATISGVRTVDLSDYPDRVAIKCEMEGARGLTADAVRRIVREETGAEPEVQVDFTAAGSRAKRARFESIALSQPQAGMIKATATLEWQHQKVTGECEGEPSLAGELRACAIATMRAVEKVAEGKVSFTLIGAKEVHVFDHDLVAVLIQSPELPDHRMIGTSIISEDRRRSAALAVLSATNRAVGNYIEATS